MSKKKTGSELLASAITDRIMEIGGEPGTPCKRIAFRGGSWPNEVDLGGLIRRPLQETIEHAIQDFFKRDTP